MAKLSFFLILFHSFFLTFLPFTYSNLTPDYYKQTCPQFPQIMQQIITDKQLAFPTTAAAALRLFFHDCMVDGCDASTLITSNSFHKAERDADINLSLPGDGFDVIARAKTALELQCPGIVSCSDILAVAARNLIVMVGGPYYNVSLGRKDSLESDPSRVADHIATPSLPLSKIISMFGAKGFSVQEMVALVGAHTIGFAHCKEFANRIFNFSKTSQFDPALNPLYANRLRKLCANYKQETEMSAYNDVMTPGKFDNMYYRNLKNGLALLQSDQAIAVDKRTKPYVDMYAANQTEFFRAFARAIEKVSVYKVKTGKEGEVRQRCHEFKNLKISQSGRKYHI